MKTNWEVEMNQYTESQPNRGAIQRNNETLEPKQCCAWAASLALTAGSVASKKEQQEENESAAFWLASGRESLSHTSAACNTLFGALRIESFLNIDNNYNNNIESLKSSNLRGNYLHKSKLDTWSICEKIPDLQNTPRICSIGFVKSTFLLLTLSSEFPDAVNKVSVRQLP